MDQLISILRRSLYALGRMLKQALLLLRLDIIHTLYCQLSKDLSILDGTDYEYISSIVNSTKVRYI